MKVTIRSFCLMIKLLFIFIIQTNLATRVFSFTPSFKYQYKLGFSKRLIHKLLHKPRHDIENMATLIDGKQIASQIRIELKENVNEIKETFNVTPGLAVILVGSRRDSSTYVNMKKKACAEVGIESFGFDYPAEVTQDVLIAKVDELNQGFIFFHHIFSFNQMFSSSLNSFL